MKQKATKNEVHRLAEAVRRVCIQAALDAYEQGGIAGLCEQGRWELAIDAMRALDVTRVLQEPERLDAE